MSIKRVAIEPGTCRTLVDFGDPDEFARWEVVNDGVMGGLSKGHIAQAGDARSGSARAALWSLLYSGHVLSPVPQLRSRCR